MTGIIPARAGFTGSHTFALWDDGDHPRSRGVYVEEPGHLQLDGGSSPLARGLLVREVHRLRLVRIIPARAGFTSGRVRHATPRRDHPRSRGVYGKGGASKTPTSRIIPARAGFTSRCPCSASWTRDHPRSRGVYWWSRAAQKLSSGSSPLARGLPEVVARCRVQRGIIPARAGFTSPMPCQPIRRPDHPRSRGVYKVHRQCELAREGSSPLARGLPEVVARCRVQRGIIPARAGFTSPMPCQPIRRPDHPRSRGVYFGQEPVRQG